MSTLYLVATPIGNLADFSFRAQTILQTVDWIAAEDTRTSQILLTHYSIQKPLFAYHQHNETGMSEKLLQKLQKGQSGALISDAGTPGIQDPGYELVRQARLAGIQVVPIPGPCALVAALSVSGFSLEQGFRFVGFLPSKPSLCRAHLSSLRSVEVPIVFYEAPHRILAFFGMLIDCFQEREIFIARELTKKFEQTWRGRLSEVTALTESGQLPIKGEFVIIVEGHPQMNEKDQVMSDQIDKCLKALLPALPLKQAVEITVEIIGGSKKVIYARALALKIE